jgi:hypothetical protein
MNSVISNTSLFLFRMVLYSRLHTEVGSVSFLSRAKIVYQGVASVITGIFFNKRYFLRVWVVYFAVLFQLEPSAFAFWICSVLKRKTHRRTLRFDDDQPPLGTLASVCAFFGYLAESGNVLDHYSNSSVSFSGAIIVTPSSCEVNTETKQYKKNWKSSTTAYENTNSTANWPGIPITTVYLTPR